MQAIKLRKSILSVLKEKPPKEIDFEVIKQAIISCLVPGEMEMVKVFDRTLVDSLFSGVTDVYVHCSNYLGEDYYYAVTVTASDEDVTVAVESTTYQTSFMERFMQALTVLCGGVEPPEAMCAAWCCQATEELQEWVLDHEKLEWASGISIIEAAEMLANSPKEGQGHLT
jgi:hypothetical protein